MKPRSDYESSGHDGRTKGARTKGTRCAEAPQADGGPEKRFVHQRRYLNKGEIVQLDCTEQCNFMLLNDANYAAYRNVRRFHYLGGTFKRFPARITVPESGDWNIIIDLAGATAEVQYNITIVIE